MTTFHEDWFGPHSCEALATLARSTNELAGEVVEVGCWEGRSTIALANAVWPATVHAVDTWAGSPGEVSAELAAERDVYAVFQENIDLATAGNVKPHRTSWEAFDWPDRIRFLHIDAEHTYENVSANIAAALPRMVEGSIMCGDDVHHPPIQKAVLEAFPDAASSATLWWVRI